jgi:protein-disulfide isomerase
LSTKPVRAGRGTTWAAWAAVCLLGPAGLLSSAPTLGQTHPATSKSAAAKSADAKPVVPADVVKGLGDKNAPVTMEVFSDYQCPSCRVLYEQALRPMIGDYVASGKVYLVHHDSPLVMHKYSGIAARWVNAAAVVRKYPEVEAALYDNQDAWQANGEMEKFVQAAVSPAEFKHIQQLMVGCTALSGPQMGGPPAAPGCAVDPLIEKDIALAKQVPVNATPTYVFIYKGKSYPPASGLVSWPLLKQFIDALLSQ